MKLGGGHEERSRRKEVQTHDNMASEQKKTTLTNKDKKEKKSEVHGICISKRKRKEKPKISRKNARDK